MRSRSELPPWAFSSCDRLFSEVLADVAVLVGRTDEENTLRINGWVTKDRFADEAQARDFGYGPRLKMEVGDLDPIESMWRRLMARRFRYNKHV